MAVISFEFLVFSVLLLIIYYTFGKGHQWIVLLLANTVFYLAGGWKGALYLLLTMQVTYLCGKKLDTYNQEQDKLVGEQKPDAKTKRAIKEAFNKKKKSWMLFAVGLNIGILCFVKYISVIMNAVSISVFVPLGISFYTFQAVGYIIDIYRGRIQSENNFFKLALFLSFFPVITQGPILRFETVKGQLLHKHLFDYQSFTFGMQRMVFGFFKKLVIAERLSIVYTSILQNYMEKGYCGIIIFVGVFLAGLHTYVDFSGGMDIMIGLSEALGIVLPENFQRPYMARTYGEFWRRWHISLGTWFKNYVFYPLSLSKLFHMLTKKSKTYFGDTVGKVIAPSLASFFTFFIIGIWHGANMKYVVYGIWQAFFVAQGTLLEHVYEKIRGFCRVDKESFYFRMFQAFRTVFLVTLGRYFSFAADLTDAFHLIGASLRKWDLHVLFDDTFYNLGLDEKNVRLVCICLVLLLTASILQEKGMKLREWIASQGIIIRWSIYLAAFFGVLIFGQYGPGYHVSDFVYQGF